MGPDMSKRFEEFCGYDKPQPPPEPNRSFVIPAQCPECGGDGRLKIPSAWTTVRENRERSERLFFTSNVAPCLYCNGHGRIGLPRIVAWCLRRYISEPLKNQFYNHGNESELPFSPGNVRLGIRCGFA